MSDAVVYSVYQCWLRLLVTVFSVLLFLTRFGTCFLLLFNGLLSMNIREGNFLLFSTVSFRNFPTYGDFPLSSGSGILPSSFVRDFSNRRHFTK